MKKYFLLFSLVFCLAITPVVYAKGVGFANALIKMCNELIDNVKKIESSFSSLSTIAGPAGSNSPTNIVGKFNLWASQIANLSNVIPNAFHGIFGGLASGMYGHHKSTQQDNHTGAAHSKSREIKKAITADMSKQHLATMLNTPSTAALAAQRHDEQKLFPNGENLSADSLIGPHRYQTEKEALAAMSFVNHVTLTNVKQQLPETLTKNPTPAVQEELHKRRAQAAHSSISAHVLHKALARRMPVQGLASAGGLQQGGTQSVQGGKPDVASSFELLTSGCNKFSNLLKAEESMISHVPLIGTAMASLQDHARLLITLRCQKMIAQEKNELSLAMLHNSMTNLMPILKDVVTMVEHPKQIPEKMMDVIKRTQGGS